MSFLISSTSSQTYTVSDPTAIFDLQISLDEDTSSCNWSDTQTKISWEYPLIDAI